MQCRQSGLQARRLATLLNNFPHIRDRHLSHDRIEVFRATHATFHEDTERVRMQIPRRGGHTGGGGDDAPGSVVGVAPSSKVGVSSLLVTRSFLYKLFLIGRCQIYMVSLFFSLKFVFQIVFSQFLLFSQFSFLK